MAAKPRDGLLAIHEIERMCHERGGSFGRARYDGNAGGVVLAVAFWTAPALADFVRLLDDALGRNRPGDLRVLGWTFRRHTQRGRGYVTGRIVVDPARLE